jgi:hypothetical protein
MTPLKKPLANAATTWGRLTDEGRSAVVLRAVLTDRTVSLPYHTLARWELSLGETETLIVHSGPLVVTVRGRRLGPLRDALDTARLEQVRAQGERAALHAVATEPWIQSITIASA